ncbi:MAG: hypothetical protein JXA08_01615 [Methanomicrobiaceae archaeon]|nr:hypothetical protein [Methanomicrobiaceae archaeon]
MRLRGYQALFLFLFLFLIVPPVAADDALSDTGYSVLVLHSYHEGYAWTDSVSAGIRSVTGSAEIPIVLSFEYMDSAGSSGEGYFRILHDYYNVVYSGRNFDAIIASDDTAFRFLSLYHASLFPDTPVIFCGVTFPDETALDGWDDCTGVVQEVTIRETLDAALALQPEARHLMVINDRSPTGISQKEQLSNLLPVYDSRIDMAYIDDMTLEGVKSTVRGVTDDTIILLLAFTPDTSGTYFDYSGGIEAIAAASPVAVYTVREDYLGLGTVGGKLTDGMFRGEAAAELTRRVLRGESASTIPVVRVAKNRWIFDYEVMQRFGISEASLPSNSEIINRPPGIIPVDIRVYWSAIVGIVMLGSAVVMLGISLRRQKRAEKALRDSREMLAELAGEQHTALLQIEKNLEQMAILNDHIRNPLTIIVGLVDLQGGKIRDTVLEQAAEIDSIINKLDVGWLESEKIREFLKKHHPGNE